jgi:hypothetical protein
MSQHGSPQTQTNQLHQQGPFGYTINNMHQHQQSPLHHQDHLLPLPYTNEIVPANPHTSHLTSEGAVDSGTNDSIAAPIQSNLHAGLQHHHRHAVGALNAYGNSHFAALPHRQLHGVFQALVVPHPSFGDDITLTFGSTVHTRQECIGKSHILIRVRQLGVRELNELKLKNTSWQPHTKNTARVITRMPLQSYKICTRWIKPISPLYFY